VRMRRRKPCVLCRRRLFGWYVRLLTSISSVWGWGRNTRGRDACRSAGTARPWRLRPWTCGTGRSPGDRPTVRGDAEGGQTGEGHLLWTNPDACGEILAAAARGLLRSAGPRFPAGSGRPSHDHRATVVTLSPNVAADLHCCALRRHRARSRKVSLHSEGAGFTDCGKVCGPP
jgi:hypothetical protein